MAPALIINKPYEDSIDVVISGLSGRFPASDNLDEFAKNLYSHIDMITEDERRWPSSKLIFQ